MFLMNGNRHLEEHWQRDQGLKSRQIAWCRRKDRDMYTSSISPAQFSSIIKNIKYTEITIFYLKLLK